MQHSNEFMEEVSSAKVAQTPMMTGDFNAAEFASYTNPHLAYRGIAGDAQNPHQMALLLHF